MHMKKIIALLVLLSAFGAAKAQQLSLTSQYMMNHFVLNPAIAGTTNYIPIDLNIRNQWVNIKGAPVTQSLSAHAYLGKNMGIGGCFFNDVTGPTRRTGMSVCLSYHVRLNKEYTRKLSFGLGGVFFQHYINKDQLTTDEPEDMSILNGFNNQFCPDANFGIYFSETDRFYVGASVMNLLEVKKDLFSLSHTIKNPIERTYYFNGGYYFDLGRDFGFEPSFLLQLQESTPLQADFNGRFAYKKIIWLGGSYRMKDAVVMMFAVDFKRFAIGYSYDLTLSEIKKHSYGSHEINLVYRIFKKDAFNKNDGNNAFPLFN
jgi:type IX secretion system PorP/SprF family membrane protein